jgi:hypothetical protein
MHCRNSLLQIVCRLVSVAFVVWSLPSDAAPPAESEQQAEQRFDADPGWEGFRNRLLPESLPRVRQHFGYRTSHFTRGDRAGEIGGRIHRSRTRAYYAKTIPTKSMNDKLSASGRFAVTEAGGGSGMLFGWFHETSRGWRTPNSLGFRIDGNGGKYWLFYEYGTRNWRTGGAGAFEGPRYQTTTTKPFPADGTVHDWSLKYDPDGNGGNGTLHFTVDGKTYPPLAVAPGHKTEGARFNHFGIWNVQIGGDALDAYFDDLVIDGVPHTFDDDPQWTGVGNQVEFDERVIRPRHDFGYAPTQYTGGEPGELGGVIFRDEQPAYYASRTGPLTLETELFASGTVAFLHAGSDSGVCIGWFNSKEKRGKTSPEHVERQKNRLAIMIEGPSRAGHYFRPVYATSAGAGSYGQQDSLTGKPPPIIRPDGAVHRWTMHYAPNGAAGNGRITVTLDGKTHTVDLEPGHNAENALFDRFGLFNIQAGGHHVEIYFDDIRYTATETR